MRNGQAGMFASLHRLFRSNDDSFDRISIRNGYDTCIKVINSFLNCNLYEG